MPRENVFVHIGMSKSGSSAIQKCLMENRDVLEKSGISYPKIGMPGNDGTAHHDIRSDLERGSASLLRRAINGSNSDAVILSCEGFWLLDDGQLELMARALSQGEVEVILYLRNPHDYLPSSYRQNIKRTGEHCSPEEYFNPHRPNLKQDFSYKLERWSQYFSLRVRAYEAVKHSIEKDFMRAIGAPLDRVDTSRRVVNTTPSDGAIWLMRLANRHLPSRASRRVRRLIKSPDYDFDFLPSIEDDVFHDYADRIIERWDVDVIREHLPDGDWHQLVGTDE